MTIYARCRCQALLQGPEEFAGKRALCPACGSQALFPALPAQPAAVAAEVARTPATAPLAETTIPKQGEDDIVDVIEFLDPPAPPPIRMSPPPVRPPAAWPPSSWPGAGRPTRRGSVS